MGEKEIRSRAKNSSRTREVDMNGKKNHTETPIDEIDFDNLPKSQTDKIPRNHIILPRSLHGDYIPPV